MFASLSDVSHQGQHSRTSAKGWEATSLPPPAATKACRTRVVLRRTTLTEAEALCFKSEADCDMRSSLPHVRTLAAKHATNPSKSYLFFKVCSRSLCAYHVHICMRYVHLFFEFLFACVHQASASTTSLTIRPYICICCARTYQLTVLNSSSLRAPRVLAPAAVQTLRPLAAAPAAAFHSIF